MTVEGLLITMRYSTGMLIFKSFSHFVSSFCCLLACMRGSKPSFIVLFDLNELIKGRVKIDGAGDIFNFEDKNEV